MSPSEHRLQEPVGQHAEQHPQDRVQIQIQQSVVRVDQERLKGTIVAGDRPQQVVQLFGAKSESTCPWRTNHLIEQRIHGVGQRAVVVLIVTRAEQSSGTQP